MPSSLECNHTFCAHCLETSLIYNQICPMCRTPVSQDRMILNGKNVNKEIQDRLSKHIDIEYLEKREELISKEKSINQKKEIVIEYGNLYIPLPTTGKKSKIKWTLYVKVISSPTPKPIKSVKLNIILILILIKPRLLN